MKHKVYLIGNAHLDPVWLWRWQEGFAEIKATFRSALDRMKEFPEFIFTCAGAAYYKWVEENEPEMFEEIRRRVKEGRWVIAGGWWVQPDCNIPSGESFVRHSLYGQRYFIEKLGAAARVGYNVDSFGHNGMLPQILKKSGMDFYVFMRPCSHEKELPGCLFWWESQDKSRVMAFRIPTSYGPHWGEGTTASKEEQKIRESLRIAGEQGLDMMNFYGVGNHGGGPTIANIKMILKLQQEIGEDRLIFSSPNEYFTDISKRNADLPVVRDDLQHHASGCYSAHSQTKWNNRKAEHRLASAEKFAAIAHHMAGFTYPAHDIKDAWENVLFNQFHDIIAGCSIPEAYQDAEESYGASLHAGARILNAAVQRLSWNVDTMGKIPKKLTKEKDFVTWEYENYGSPVVVFNSLSWDVCVPVEVNRPVSGITDECRNPIEIQKTRASRTDRADKWNTVFMAQIPAMGYRVYWIYLDREFSVDSSAKTMIAESNLLENDLIRFEIEPHTGYMKSFYDKVNDVDIMRGSGAIPVVVDIRSCDTWAHGVFEFRNETGRFGDAKATLVEKGPLYGKIRVVNRYNTSVLTQDFILYRDKAYIEVKAKIDWREKHKMLKLSFPANINEPAAAYEIPYGYIERPVNGEEEPGQKWVDITGFAGGDKNLKYGVALLNDCKYSFDIKDHDIRMTVANSSIFADHFGERDDLCELMDQGIHEFQYIILPHAGDWRDAGVVRTAYELNERPVVVMETYHKGSLPQKFEGIKISRDHIVASVFKKAEDGDGYILRCYETSGRRCDAAIEIPMLNRVWTAVFGENEIKTFWIPEDEGKKVTERNLVEL